jgi:hypothetical protein
MIDEAGPLHIKVTYPDFNKQFYKDVDLDQKVM